MSLNAIRARSGLDKCKLILRHPSPKSVFKAPLNASHGDMFEAIVGFYTFLRDKGFKVWNHPRYLVISLRSCEIQWSKTAPFSVMFNVSPIPLVQGSVFNYFQYSHSVNMFKCCFEKIFVWFTTKYKEFQVFKSDTFVYDFEWIYIIENVLMYEISVTYDIKFKEYQAVNIILNHIREVDIIGIIKDKRGYDRNYDYELRAFSRSLLFFPFNRITAKQVSSLPKYRFYEKMFDVYRLYAEEKRKIRSESGDMVTKRKKFDYDASRGWFDYEEDLAETNFPNRSYYYASIDQLNSDLEVAKEDLKNVLRFEIELKNDGINQYRDLFKSDTFCKFDFSSKKVFLFFFQKFLEIREAQSLEDFPKEIREYSVILSQLGYPYAYISLTTLKSIDSIKSIVKRLKLKRIVQGSGSHLRLVYPYNLLLSLYNCNKCFHSSSYSIVESIVALMAEPRTQKKVSKIIVTEQEQILSFEEQMQDNMIILEWYKKGCPYGNLYNY